MFVALRRIARGLGTIWSYAAVPLAAVFISFSIVSGAGVTDARAQGIAVEPEPSIPDLPCMTPADRRALQRLKDEMQVTSGRFHGLLAQLDQLWGTPEGKQLSAAEALIKQVDTAQQGIATTSDQFREYQNARATVRRLAPLRQKIDALIKTIQGVAGKYVALDKRFDAMISEIKKRNCDPPPIGPIEPMSLPFDPIYFNFEGSLFAGGVGATSFGTDYSTHIVGGRSAAGILLPGRFRLQGDIEGEKTGDYCVGCGSRSYFAYATHFGWSPTGNTDIGLVGGFQDVKPTFHGPSNTNGFIGFEGRFVFPNFMVGGQAGFLDATSGVGTLNDAWFAEGRAKVRIVPPNLSAPITTVPYPDVLRRITEVVVGATLGHASGKLADTSLGASSTYWDVNIAVPFNNSRWTGFVDYTGYTNHVQGLGTVWTEHVFKGGVKFNFSGSSSGQQNIEPMLPLPIGLRTSASF